MTQPTASEHVAAAMEHLAGAAEAETGSATERYHLSVAATQATLASVAVAQAQAEAAQEAVRINSQLLEYMAQGAPTPTADAVARSKEQ